MTKQTQDEIELFQGGFEIELFQGGFDIDDDDTTADRDWWWKSGADNEGA